MNGTIAAPDYNPPYLSPLYPCPARPVVGEKGHSMRMSDTHWNPLASWFNYLVACAGAWLLGCRVQQFCFLCGFLFTGSCSSRLIGPRFLGLPVTRPLAAPALPDSQWKDVSENALVKSCKGILL